MLDANLVDQIGLELFHCLQERRTIVPLTERYADLEIGEAYKISRAFLAHRRQHGERVGGKKIGVTSSAVQDMLGVYQPDFGFLTDAMWVKNGVVDTSRLIAPRAEAEIAFRLKSSLKGPGVTPEDVLAATGTVMACFEIVDSRIRDWQISICDTIADNASCGVFVLSEHEVPVGELNLADMQVTVRKNGKFLSQGMGSEVQGAPENAVAWLANTLGEYGMLFESGEIILSGSMVPLAEAVAGDIFAMSIDGIGDAEVRFI